MRHWLYALIFSLGCTTCLMAHGSFILHCEDMMQVFGFEDNTLLFSRNKDTRSNTSWTKFISSDMIDNVEFHRQLESKYEGFKIASPRMHRLLFHWAYNQEPWNRYLESHIRAYCRLSERDEATTIQAIKSDVKAEQKRRNRKINAETERLFGFAHGGKDAKFAEFFASMAYNIHLLGDQQTDNTIFLGVAHTSTLIEQIIISLRMLDNTSCKPIIVQLTRLNNEYDDEHRKADAVMAYLKTVIPGFIKRAQKGNIYRRLKDRGFKIK